nr:hypothetical protein [Tanacetum cinerariifolium]
MLAQSAVVEGEGLRNPHESQTTPSPAQPINQSQILKSSSSPQNTQSPRQTLEGTGFPHNRGSNFPDPSVDVEAVYKEEGEGSGSGPGHQETIEGAMAQIRYEGALIQSIDPPLSTGYTVRSKEDRMEHDIELTDHVPQKPNDSPLSGDKGNGEKGGSIAKSVSTARPDISAARQEVGTAEPKTPPTTATLFDDEDVTIADTLVKMKNQKAKQKGIAFKNADDSARPIRSITTLQPLLTIDPKDKGKGILQEPKSMKKSKKMDQDQIKRDAKVPLKIQADLDEEARTERIDVDHELAIRLTHEEQEKYTVEESSKLLAEFFKRKKKQLAKERAEEIRSKPPTKTQLRNLMMTYLKHTVRFTHAQLKSRGFEEIQKLYIKEQKWKVNDQESKDSNKEHRKCLKVVPDDDKAINYETLDVKTLIVDCESQVLGINKAGDIYVYKLTRLDGSYRYFSTFSKILEVLDRQNVLDLHKIIIERFPTNDPEGYDLILWGDLKTLAESSKDDKI